MRAVKKKNTNNSYNTVINSVAITSVYILFSLIFIDKSVDYWLFLEASLIVCLPILTFLVLQDISKQRLNQKLYVVLLALTSLRVLLYGIITKDLQMIALSLAGAMAISLLFYGVYRYSKGVWLQKNDVLLAPAFGLLVMGLVDVFLLLFFASLLALIYTLPSVLNGNKNLKSKVPLSPFLALALGVVLLWGGAIIDFWESLLV